MMIGGSVVYLLLGLGAGVLTTIAGQGGGLLLLLAISAFRGPHEALAITAPALLLGNLHRTLILRKFIDRAVAIRMVLGAVPGAFVGGMLVGVIPAWGLRALLIAITVVAVAKALGFIRFGVPRAALVPAGFGIGAMTGTSGGAGVLFAPVLLSAGLTGRAFVATSSTIAFSTHVGRVVGYAGLGLFSVGLILPTVFVTGAIFVGNALGDRIRTAFLGGVDDKDPVKIAAAAKRMTVLEYGTLVVCVVLSVVGLG
jgi:uncharacterized protein